MRRIVSLVWNDISKIQKIGNMKKMTTSAMQDAAQDLLERGVWSMAALTLAAGAFAQPQPVLDEDVRQEIGDRPEDDHQSRRAPDIGRLEEVQIGLHLEDQSACRPARLASSRR